MYMSTTDAKVTELYRTLGGFKVNFLFREMIILGQSISILSDITKLELDP